MTRLKQNLPFYFLLLLVATMPFGWMQAIGISLFTASVVFCQPLTVTIENLRSRPVFWLFIATYLLYVAAMAYTANMPFGIRELEYKLSLLILPVSLAALPALGSSRLKSVAGVFVGANILAAITTFIISSSGIGFSHIPTYIELSIFLHPGYFSTYLNLCFIMVFLIFMPAAKTRTSAAIAYAVAAFIILFNILLESKMGIITSVLLILIFLLRAQKRVGRKTALISMGVFLAAILVVFTQVSSVRARFQQLYTVFNAENIPRDSRESTALRILIWNQVLVVLQDHAVLGVGTGDTKDVLVEQFRKNGIVEAYKLRLNAHNQYLEWMLTFGIIGTAIWLFSFAVPLAGAIKGHNSLYLMFTLVILLAFVAESFLEREAGIVFFAFFNSLLFFHGKEKLPARSSGL